MPSSRLKMKEMELNQKDEEEGGGGPTQRVHTKAHGGGKSHAHKWEVANFEARR